MIFRLICPSGHVLDVDAQLAGRKIRCGACGAIMLVPTAAKGPAKPMAKPPAKPLAKPPAARPAKPIAQPQTKPPLKPPPVELPPVRPSAKPTAQEPCSPLPAPCSLPSATPPNLPREEGMVAVPLPPVEQPKRAAAVGMAAVARQAGADRAFFSWLRKLWPAAERRLPAGATIPGQAERRRALQLAAVPAGAAVVSLLPLLGLGHGRLFAPPPWALAAAFLAVLQVVYALWMINVPDWAAARVQMVVSAILATIYGMLMTLTTITPVNHPLILGLGDVRRAAPAWCGLMLVLMGAATWFCGRTSARWRRNLMPRSEE